MANGKRLIDANAVINEIVHYYNNSPFPHPRTNWRRGLELAASLLICESTVDAVEVVHGRWIVDAVEVDHPFLEFESVWRDVHQCSICKEYFDVSDARNYCPNCGAKMDGGNEDENL